MENCWTENLTMENCWTSRSSYSIARNCSTGTNCSKTGSSCWKATNYWIGWNCWTWKSYWIANLRIGNCWRNWP